MSMKNINFHGGRDPLFPAPRNAQITRAVPVAMDREPVRPETAETTPERQAAVDAE